MSNWRKLREYTEEFKLQSVQLYNNGFKRVDLIREYELTPSTLGTWIKKYNTNQSFKASNNLTYDQKEIIKLKK